MSKHHTLPPIIYTPPPKPKKIEKKRGPGVGMLGAFDEATESGETGAPGQATSLRLPMGNFPEIEGSDRKPRHPQGRLSQSTLSVLLKVQEYE